ncbi:MAG: ParB/RepB/Spo0J family partition protein [Selenomonadaceae bacterium]|nr:ParB/RepB/Spo0J family partition protein [Selenomonadaceae bacterium]MDY2686270.1 ParB/RepB/Spo0J family partition protein [Selenomonadaceae bacterium]
MTTKKGGLGGQGMGLGALLAQKKPVPEKDKVQEIAIDRIQANRYQPRQDFEETALDELKSSIQRYGVLQPLLVRKVSDAGDYELIAGERRLRAAKLAGLKTVPAMVRSYNDAETSEIAIIENIQRENLNAIEEARAYGRLIREFGLKQEELAAKVGRSRPYIANSLRLLKLDAKVQGYLVDGVLTMGQVRPLVRLDDPALQRATAAYIEEHQLSARACETLVRKLAENPDYLQEKAQKKPAAGEQNVYLRDAQENLSAFFGTQVKIVPGKRKGRIQIDYYDEDDLNRILDLLRAGGANGEKTEAEKQRKIEALRQFSVKGKLTV